MTTMRHDVFLSHSHVDKVYADAVCHKLEASGIRCWVAPRDIRPSEDWAEAIINAMDNCRILLLIFSSSSNSSPQVRREVERAVNKGLSVLPFRIENVPLSKSLEYFISTQHWLDAISGDVEHHLGQLLDCVSMLLGGIEPPVPMPPLMQVLPLPPSLESEPTPVTAPVPALPAALVEALTIQLAQVLGPIARHLVRRHAVPGITAASLIAALAQEIDDDAERKRFIANSRAVEQKQF